MWEVMISCEGVGENSMCCTVSVLKGDELICDQVKDAIESCKKGNDQSKLLLCFEPVP